MFRMKKLITNILICMFLLLTTSSLVGCTKDNNRFNTELFKCMYNKDKTGVIILELTDKGQEQEILVIPEEINNLPVIQLGGDTKGYPYVVSHDLDSDVIKKIYYKTKQQDGNRIVNQFNSGSDIDIIFIVDSIIDAKILVNYFSSGRNVNGEIVCNNFYANIVQEQFVIGEYYTIKKCNTYFYTAKDAIYWLDIINEKDYHIIPEEPIKAGYHFAGWYYEEECINKWDEKFILPTDAGELKLYAKWVQND